MLPKLDNSPTLPNFPHTVINPSELSEEELKEFEKKYVE